MFRLILIALMVVTILMPRRFYSLYMKVMAALALLFIALVIISYEHQPDAASNNDIYVMIGFVSMNAVIIVTKYWVLRRMRERIPKLPAPESKE